SPMSITVLFALGVAIAQAPNGQALFESKCSTCHTAAGDARTPSATALRQRTPQAILDALTTGPMREQGSELSDAEKRAVAAFLGAAAGAGSAPMTGRCTATPPFDPSAGPRWTGWSGDVTNTRFQPAKD